MKKIYSRREFIKAGAVGAAGFTLLPSMVSRAASDRLRIAHIGLGGMGNQHVKWFSALPNVDIVALCDLDEDHLNGTLKTLKSLNPENKAKGYGDFRHVLDRKDIDAITVATPDHWHAQIASLAFQAGKDVYGEKPLSYDIKEGQRMLELLNHHNRVFQLGTQIHATDNYHRVAEIIQSGAIGKVHTVRMWKTGESPGLGKPKVQAPPKTLNWDMWLGPAPDAGYFPERCHFNFRYFLDYSGGIFADFWCHIADIVWWSVQPQGLKSVVAKGDKTDGIADVPKWLAADFVFQDLNVFWTAVPPDVPGAAERGLGAYFEGEKGSLICDYDTRSITIDGKTFTDIPEIPKSINRSPGHQQNFVDAVKRRAQAESDQPESSLEYARQMTMPMHLALISWRLDRRLNWDPEKETFIGDEEANGYLSRKRRKAWDLI